MNREIKFRAYFDRKGSEEMFYNVGYHPTILEFHTFDGHDKNNGGITVCPEAIGYHIMQYTGLKDKNGKEIYEGDILSFRKLKYKVFGVAGGFAINSCQDDISKEHTPFFECIGDVQNASYIEQNCEVIGNIYENPELLTPPTQG